MEQATLLAMLRDNRDLFEQTLAKVREPLLTQPPADGELSAKDIVAHVTAWEGRLIGWLEAAARGEEAPIPEAGATWAEMDRLNAATYAANKDRPLGEVLMDKRRSFARMMQCVAGFSDEELSDPQRFPWLDVPPLWRRIARGPGFGHYQAHLYDLWLRIAPAERFTPDPAHLARCAGAYASSTERRTFTVEGDHLLLMARDNAGGSLRKPCYALDPFRFAYEEGGTVTFDKEDDDVARGMEVWSYRFARVPDGPEAEGGDGEGAGA
jgi:hypothetical protein